MKKLFVIYSVGFIAGVFIFNSLQAGVIGAVITGGIHYLWTIMKDMRKY
jgi:hypothetical protein